MSVPAEDMNVSETEGDVTESKLNVSEAIKNAFLSGMNSEKKIEDDEIKLAMIQAGAKFKNVTRIFNELKIEYGFDLSKEAKEVLVNSACEGQDLSTEEGFGAAVGYITENEDKLNERQAGALVRGYAKKQGVEFYKKPKPESTRISFTKDYYAALYENPNMTEKEVHQYIVEHGSENTLKFESNYQKIRLLANSIAAKYAA